MSKRNNTVIVIVSGGVAEVYEPSLPKGWNYVVLDMDAAESEGCCAACQDDIPPQNTLGLCKGCFKLYAHALA